MPIITVRRFTGGIDSNVAPHELRDDQFVEMRNLLPSLEAVSPRPTAEPYLDPLPGPVQAVTEYFWGIGSRSGVLEAGPAYPSQIVIDNSVGTVGWENSDAARFSDDLRARTPAPPSDGTHQTHRLVARDFGFRVPSNAQIVGVRVEIERHFTANDSGVYRLGVQDREVLISPAPGLYSENRARAAESWQRDTDRTDAYGSSDDLWGLVLTPAQVNSSDFSVVISCAVSMQSEWRDTDFGGYYVYYYSQALVDSVRVTVFYRVSDAGGLIGKETVVKVGPAVYTDRHGSWNRINSGTDQDLDEAATLRAASWLNVLYIQDGVTGPWKYVGGDGSFSVWGTGSPNPPPVAKYIMLDRERLYCAALPAEPNAVRTSTISQPDDWPLVARPGTDKGMVMYVGKDDGDYITGLVRFAGIKVILKRRSIWALYGDDVDTWQLRRLFQVGAVSDSCWADMGFAAAFTDGERVYLWDGTSLVPEFGLPVEKYLKQGLGPRLMVWWDGRLLLWYDTDKLVVWDSRWKAWYGPWDGLDVRSVYVRRDDGVLMLGQADRVATLTGKAPVDWRLETKHWNLDQYFSEFLVRKIWLRAVGIPRMLAGIQESTERVYETELSASIDSRVGRNVHVKVGQFGMFVEARSGADSRIFEIALEAYPIRQIRG